MDSRHWKPGWPSASLVMLELLDQLTRRIVVQAHISRGREFVAVQRRVLDLDNDAVVGEQFQHLRLACQICHLRHREKGYLLTRLHDAIL